VHRDIKLDNILISNKASGEYDVKIADFGMATFTNNQDGGFLKQWCGTPGYVAPEILRRELYNQKCDIFSLASVFFNLLTGCYLFQGDDSQEVLEKNKECDFPGISEILQDYSESCKNILECMLNSDPKKRYTANEAL
jgi:calcium/calmodulin-dependent protein kinase I